MLNVPVIREIQIKDTLKFLMHSYLALQPYFFPWFWFLTELVKNQIKFKDYVQGWTYGGDLIG